MSDPLPITIAPAAGTAATPPRPAVGSHGSVIDGSLEHRRQRVQVRVVAKFKGKVAMDKDRIAGSAKEVKGSLKEAAGKVLGDAKLEAEGKADKAEGKIQNAAGGIKDAARDAVKK